jgi:hypothetical protein
VVEQYLCVGQKMNPLCLWAVGALWLHYWPAGFVGPLFLDLEKSLVWIDHSLMDQMADPRLAVVQISVAFHGIVHNLVANLVVEAVGDNSHDHRFVLCHDNGRILLGMIILDLFLVHDHDMTLEEMVGEEALVVHIEDI